MGIICCPTCRESFDLLSDTETVLRRTGKTFYCPWGHSMYFPRGLNTFFAIPARQMVSGFFGRFTIPALYITEKPNE